MRARVLVVLIVLVALLPGVVVDACQAVLGGALELGQSLLDQAGGGHA
ncbi:MAG: hypothetical protein ACRDYU_01090 [Actinomycetes bacterium]